MLTHPHSHSSAAFESSRMYSPLFLMTFPESLVGCDVFVAADKSRPEPASPSTSGTSAGAAARLCEAAMRTPVARTDSLRGGFSNVVYRISFLGYHPPVLFRSVRSSSSSSSSSSIIVKDRNMLSITLEPFVFFQIFRPGPRACGGTGARERGVYAAVTAGDSPENLCLVRRRPRFG